MKTLKFEAYLADLIVKGEKTTTWRLFDDKNLTAGDEVDLLEFVTKKKFAKAKLTSVIEKDFSELTESDWIGQKKFANDDEMYETFSRMYKQPVNPKTKLKIIKFVLIK